MKKVVLKLELHNDKAKQKAMKIVSGLPGVESIAMDSKDNKLTITGDIDPVTLVAKLRKLCSTNIVSVGPAKEPEKKKEEPKKDEPKKEDDKKKAEAIQTHLMNYHAFYNQQHPNHQLYTHHQYPPPMPAYYGRSVEEDPNACVIC